MSKPLFKPLLLSLLCAAALTGCQIKPDSTADFAGSIAKQEGVVSTKQNQLIDYKSFFKDEHLQQYISAALQHNHDVAIAQLNLAKVQAIYQLEQADAWPQVMASAGQTRTGLAQSQGGGINQQAEVAVGITAFELDFFGKQQNLTEQALQQFYASEQAVQVTQLRIIAEVANAYTQVQANQQQWQIAKETVENQQASLTIISEKARLGAVSELDLAQTSAQLASAKTEQIRLARQLALAQNALQILLGNKQVNAANLPSIAPELASIDTQAFADGLPASLLAQRPDLRQAEHQLQAAEANIAHARTAFFPSISLTSKVGSASNELNGLFDSGSGAWVFSPSIQLPIFDGGRNNANLAQSQVARDIVLADYQHSIRQAFREVRDALIERSSYQQQLQSQTELLEHLATSYRLAQARYQAGADSYLQVLDAQRSWYNGKQQHIQLQQANLTAQISLFKALGGGMQP